jgi:hypothetical protein
MDPYLEAPELWPDLHQRLITYMADVLQSQIRPAYHARAGERLYVVETQRSIYPDVTIIRRPTPQPELVSPGGAAVALAPPADTPWILSSLDDETREPFVEIVHTASGRVVTVIEVLSPANKIAGQGYNLYRQKQAEILNSTTHLVEIDLLSQGLLTVALTEEQLAQLPSHRYRVVVSRGPAHLRREIYPVALSQRLPRCRIPLKAPDPDVMLDLPTIFARAYDNGGYADFVDYRLPSLVPLSADEQAWTAENVRVADVE